MGIALLLGRLSRRLGSRHRRMALLGALTLAVFAGAAGSLLLVGSPSMCAACHHTRPAVQTWRTSPHRTVHCLECHAGVKMPADALGRASASLQAAKQFAARAATQQQMAQGSSVCTRQGCHTDTAKAHGLKTARYAFDHYKHLETERETVELTCVSCHPQSAHSPAPGPAKDTCALCHKKDMGPSASPAKCYVCHPRPIGSQKGGFAHDPLGASGEDCLLCHGSVYGGKADAPAERCLKHMSAEDYREMSPLPSMLHYATVTERDVSCFECHHQPTHRSSRRPVPRSVAEAQKGR